MRVAAPRRVICCRAVLEVTRPAALAGFLQQGRNPPVGEHADNNRTGKGAGLEGKEQRGYGCQKLRPAQREGARTAPGKKGGGDEGAEDGWWDQLQPLGKPARELSPGKDDERQHARQVGDGTHGQDEENVIAAAHTSLSRFLARRFRAKPAVAARQEATMT